MEGESRMHSGARPSRDENYTATVTRVQPGPAAGFEADGGQHFSPIGQLPSNHCLQVGRGTGSYQ